MGNMNGTESENGMNGLVFDENGKLDVVASAPALKTTVECVVVSINVPDEFLREKKEEVSPSADINQLMREDLWEERDHLVVEFDDVE